MGAGKQGLGDSGTDTGNAQVGGGPREGAGVGAMTGLRLGSPGWYYGDRSRDRGKGGGYGSV